MAVYNDIKQTGIIPHIYFQIRLSIRKYLLFSNKEDDVYFYANILKTNIYKAIGKYYIAIEIYKYLLEEIPKPKDPLLGYIYNNLGLVYLYKEEFKISLEYFEMAEKISTANDEYNLCHTLIEKSGVFFRHFFHIKAIKTIRLGLSGAEFYKSFNIC